MDSATGRSGVDRRTAGDVFDLLRRGAARTPADLSRRTGLTDPEVAVRVDALLQLGVVAAESGSEGEATAGSPALAVNADAGVLMAADLGATHARLALTDLVGDVLAERADDLMIARGPGEVLGFVQRRFDELLAETGRRVDDVWGIGIGVPGPVESANGRPVHPPIMPGWDGVSIPSFFAADYPGVPVLADNDVNVMAMGEYWARWGTEDHLLYVKVGTGIGCGIVAGGRIHRGAKGAAGDIGHIRVFGQPDVVCHCGNVSCLEAHAGGLAMARRLTEMGFPAAGSRDVVRLIEQGEPAAARVVREGGRLIGAVLAAVVNFFNPSVIVVGGAMAQARNLLLAGIREVVYQRSLPLATRDLTLVTGELGQRAGIVGAAAMTSERVLSVAAIDERIETAAGRRGARFGPAPSR